MRLVLATPIYPPDIGGPATYAVALAERLRDAHDITIVAYTNEGVPVEDTRLVKVTKRLPLPVRLIAYTLKLYGAARGADVIYAQNALAAGLPALLVGKLRRTPVVIKCVGDEAWERAAQAGKTTKTLEEFLAHPEGSFYISLLRTLQGWVLRHVDLVTTPSAYLLKALCAAYRIKPERGVVNYNAVEAYEGIMPPRVSGQVSVASRLVAWKHVDQVIRARVEVKKHVPEAQLIIAGDGPEKQSLERLVKELGAESFVHFRGKISQAEARQLQASSTLHVLNSTYEGLPYEVLNSFAVGTPVVATNISGTNEIVVHEKTGLLVPPGDTAALAAAIVQLCGDAALRGRLAAGGSKLLAEQCSWNKHLSVLLSNFSRVADITTRYGRPKS